jgi:hypothetical protein
MLIVGRSIFHKRRRKFMALIPLNERTRIAAPVVGNRLNAQRNARVRHRF